MFPAASSQILRTPLPQLLIVALLSGCGGSGAPDTPPDQSILDPGLTGDRVAWLGADVATSIKVADDHYVWLFGDTYLGSVDTEDDCSNGEPYCNRVAETHPPDIHNTIGVAKRHDGSWGDIAKYWRDGDGGNPGEIFESATSHFYWPMTGTMVGRKMLVAAARMGHGVMVEVGTTFFLVSNPTDAPDTWGYTSHDADTTGVRSWTTAVVKNGSWVYIFGVPARPRTGSIVSRISISEAEAGNWSNRQYLQSQGGGPPRWGEEMDSLFDTKLPAVSETTIEWDPTRGLWYSIQIPASSFSVELHTATSLDGEWAAAGEIFKVPSQWSEATICAEGSSGVCGDGGPAYNAYAAKLHPWLAEGDEIVFTYNINTSLGSLTKGDDVLRSNFGFYVPQLTSVSWPDSLG